MFGSDNTGPDSSLVGHWKENPLLSLPGGRWAIGQVQHRERHAHHRVITPAVARPYLAWSSHRPGDRLDPDGDAVFLVETMSRSSARRCRRVCPRCPSGCTCIDYCLQLVLLCTMLCKLHTRIPRER